MRRGEERADGADDRGTPGARDGLFGRLADKRLLLLLDNLEQLLAPRR